MDANQVATFAFPTAVGLLILIDRAIRWVPWLRQRLVWAIDVRFSRSSLDLSFRGWAYPTAHGLWMGALAVAAVAAFRSYVTIYAALSSGARAHPIVAMVAFSILTLWMYQARSSKREWYGSHEIGFGLAVAWQAITRSGPSPEASFAALVGAVYVIVRGLDNFLKGWPDVLAKGREDVLRLSQKAAPQSAA